MIVRLFVHPELVSMCVDAMDVHLGIALVNIEPLARVIRSILAHVRVELRTHISLDVIVKVGLAPLLANIELLTIGKQVVLVFLEQRYLRVNAITDPI